jgi:hypothetical protein
VTPIKTEEVTAWTREHIVFMSFMEARCLLWVRKINVETNWKIRTTRIVRIKNSEVSFGPLEADESIPRGRDWRQAERSKEAMKEERDKRGRGGEHTGEITDRRKRETAPTAPMFQNGRYTSS